MLDRQTTSPLGPVPENWCLVTLKEITSKIGSGATPLGGEKVYLSERHTYALIRSQCVFDRLLDLSRLAFIDDGSASGLSNVAIEENDLLLNITGDGITFGRCCMVSPEALPARVNQHVSIIRVDPRFADAGYVLSYLTHPITKGYIESFNAGGSRRAITKGHIESFVLPLPPLEEQKAIATVLGVLDDKIELNRQMNETLEAMARAIFKDWFVDFGPTRAKQEARSATGATGKANSGRAESFSGANGASPTRAYLAPDIWSLFPDRLDDEGKPEGWTNSTIGAEVEVVGGSTPSTKDASYWSEGRYCWATPKDLSTLGHPVLLDTERKITDAGVAVISSGLLPSGTVLLSSRAPIGYLAIAEVPTAINQGFIAMRCTGQILNLFALMWCRENMDAITANANGSTFQEISKSNFRPIVLVRPHEGVLEAFESICRSLHNRLVANVKESGTLSGLRDLLLPKLMSGEIRIKDAEKMVGEAV